MNKLRPIRFKNMSVDMAALCDLAFLLLVFFVVTARFDQWEPMKIDMPLTQHRISDISDDPTGIVYITDNKVMYQVTNDRVRLATLQQMSDLYHVPFSKTEQAMFMNSPIIGAPIGGLKEYDSTYMDWEGNIDRPGIPYNTAAPELFDWIKQSRLATRALFNRDMRVIIKADKSVQYPVIKQVIAILQKQKLNRFSLLTDARRSEL